MIQINVDNFCSPLPPAEDHRQRKKHPEVRFGVMLIRCWKSGRNRHGTVGVVRQKQKQTRVPDL